MLDLGLKLNAGAPSGASGPPTLTGDTTQSGTMVASAGSLLYRDGVLVSSPYTKGPDDALATFWVQNGTVKSASTKIAAVYQSPPTGTKMRLRGFVLNDGGGSGFKGINGTEIDIRDANGNHLTGSIAATANGGTLLDSGITGSSSPYFDGVLVSQSNYSITSDGTSVDLDITFSGGAKSIHGGTISFAAVDNVAASTPGTFNLYLYNGSSYDLVAAYTRPGSGWAVQVGVLTPVHNIPRYGTVSLDSAAYDASALTITPVVSNVVTQLQTKYWDDSVAGYPQLLQDWTNATSGVPFSATGGPFRAGARDTTNNTVKAAAVETVITTPAFDVAAKFGSNDTAPDPYVAIAYTNLAMQSTMFALPGGFPITYEAGGPELLPTGICGADWGMTRDDCRLGATGTWDAATFAAATFRVDDKKFRATPAYADPGQFEIASVFASDQGYGRYCGMSNTAITFSDGGTDGYMQFGSDSDLFWTYAYASTFTSFGSISMYYSIWVESGTFQVYDGDPGAGGTLKREITSADNGTEWASEFTVQSSSIRMYLRRKSGTGTAKLRRCLSFIKGSDVTGILFTVANQSPAMSIAMTSNVGTSWSPQNSLVGKMTWNSGTGSCTITMDESHDKDFQRQISFDGISGSMAFPAGGLDLALTITTAGHSSGTVWDQLALNDLAAIHSVGFRTLDWQPTNKITWRKVSATFGVANTKPQMELHPCHLAARANVASMSYVWNSLPPQWTQTRFVDFHKKLLTGDGVNAGLNSNIVAKFEPPNESWNSPGYAGSLWAAKDATAKGITAIESVADTMHDYLDWILADGTLAPLLGTRLKPVFAWGLFQIDDTSYALAMNRTRSAVTLRTRLALYGGHFSTSGYCYLPTFAQVSAVTGTGQSVATYQAEIDVQFATAVTTTQNLLIVNAQRIATDCVAHSLSQNAIPYDLYEVGTEQADFGHEANWDTALQNYIYSTQRASKMRSHKDWCITRGIGVNWYRGGPGLNDGTFGIYGMLPRTGYDAVNNTSNIYTAFAA